MQKHVGDRPVTLPILRAAWLACQRGLIPKQNENESAMRISETDLQRLTDDSIAELYGGVRRERATEESKFRALLRGQ
jgi:hypothetical protein